MLPFHTYDLHRTFQNGDRYDGQAIEEGIKHGLGTYRWGNSGTIYEGQWFRDKMHGKGILRNDGMTGKASYTFEGMFVDGMRCGEGVLTLHDQGEVYSGTFLDNEIHGMGQQTLIKSVNTKTEEKCVRIAHYEGEFIAGVRCGFGRAAYTDGSEYTGMWDNGVWHGPNGVWKTANGSLFEGPFRDGVPHAPPSWVDPVSSDSARENQYVCTVYRQLFDLVLSSSNADFLLTKDVWALVPQNRIHHEYDTEQPHAEKNIKDSTDYVGRWSYPDGTVYIGTIVRGTIEGYGIHTYKDGTCYIGPFHGGLRHSTDPEQLIRTTLPQDLTIGTRCNLPGHPEIELTGQWVNNVLSDRSGMAKIRTAIERYQGEVVDGVPHGYGTCTWFKSPQSKEVIETYQGAWIKGRMQGFGTRKRYCDQNPMSLEWEYIGEHVQGKMHTQDPSGLISHVEEHSSEGFICLFVHYREGWKYQGGWFQGMRQGHGELTIVKYGSPCTYRGEMRANHPNGLGQWDYGSGFTTQCMDNTPEQRRGGVYVGSVREGIPHGKGRHTYPNGDYYEGQWRKGSYEGEGMYFWADTGNTYTGTWRHSTRHGEGVEIVVGVHEYTGSFENGCKQGYGVCQYNRKEEGKYEGQWRNDVYHGYGLLETSEWTYEGQFQDGQRMGFGTTLFHATKLKYEGVVIDGKHEGGRIRIHQPNGDIYEGGVRQGRRNGPGVMRFVGGSCLYGHFVNDVLHGPAISVYITSESSTPLYIGRTYDEGVQVRGSEYQVLHPSQEKWTSPPSKLAESPERPHTVSLSEVLDLLSKWLPLEESEQETAAAPSFSSTKQTSETEIFPETCSPVGVNCSGESTEPGSPLQAEEEKVNEPAHNHCDDDANRSPLTSPPVRRSPSRVARPSIPTSNFLRGDEAVISPHEDSNQTRSVDMSNRTSESHFRYAGLRAQIICNASSLSSQSHDSRSRVSSQEDDEIAQILEHQPSPDISPSRGPKQMCAFPRVIPLTRALNQGAIEKSWCADMLSAIIDADKGCAWCNNTHTLCIPVLEPIRPSLRSVSPCMWDDTSARKPLCYQVFISLFKLGAAPLKVRTPTIRSIRRVSPTPSVPSENIPCNIHSSHSSNEAKINPSSLHRDSGASLFSKPQFVDDPEARGESLSSECPPKPSPQIRETLVTNLKDCEARIEVIQQRLSGVGVSVSQLAKRELRTEWQGLLRVRRQLQDALDNR